MVNDFGYKTGKAVKALEFEDYYSWDSSVIKVNGKYHMFTSRWDRKYGFGWNWLFHSEIVHSVSDSPEGPYKFQNVALPRRGREYFDGMNTHNTCIKQYGGKFYLYYMGCTYGGDVPKSLEDVSEGYALETWNRKRIGVAVADDINGEFVRCDTPLLEPRDCRYWDCTITTNPSVTILSDGKTYMIYKSRCAVNQPLQLGIAVADRPDGNFRRLSDEPILQFKDKEYCIEDPFFWYDEKREKFCLIAKDDCKDETKGITGQWGSGFYAESDDCINFEIAQNPMVYSRELHWADGNVTVQGNLERPSVLFDENGNPTHLFCASGDGSTPYCFKGNTFVVCMKLDKK
ncbi:MAG: glycoside hydrolase family protein [Tyzzerella sp.]|nr:glycoside hydrolase family protein [Tyzzerella sp.]